MVVRGSVHAMVLKDEWRLKHRPLSMGAPWRNAPTTDVSRDGLSANLSARKYGYL